MMNFQHSTTTPLRSVFLFFLFVGMFSLSCKEELPVYVPPEKVLSVKVELVEQLADRIAPPGAQMIRIKLVGENIYDEVFFDTVNIRGTMKISWLRNPGRERTIEFGERDFLNQDLISNKKMMLLPGQQIGFQFYWNLKGDDSVYFPREMNYVYAFRRECARHLGYQVICSDPEEMIVQGELSVFKNLEVISVSPFLFTVIGKAMVYPNGGLP
ncbi:MAG: hypothetical protein HY960_09355 [Ignavibacteriae bacterium]|nr:hypothetical protein [Ignavibacteriota bacterium]